MIESSSSLIIHSNTEDDMSSSPSKRKPGHQIDINRITAVAQLANKNSSSPGRHNKSTPTLSDILYTSQQGINIYI